MQKGRSVKRKLKKTATMTASIALPIIAGALLNSALDSRARNSYNSSFASKSNGLTKEGMDMRWLVEGKGRRRKK